MYSIWWSGTRDAVPGLQINDKYLIFGQHFCIWKIHACNFNKSILQLFNHNNVTLFKIGIVVGSNRTLLSNISDVNLLNPFKNSNELLYKKKYNMNEKFTQYLNWINLR